MFKRHKIKNHSDMFRNLCDPSSGSRAVLDKFLVVVHRYFVVCLVSVWQRNFEPVVCVYGTAHDKISVNHYEEFQSSNTSVLADDGSH
jgi:hypothetical protein